MQKIVFLFTRNCSY